MLGAAGLRDIGYYFPDTDEKFKGIRSTELLNEAQHIIAGENYEVNNIDAIVVAEYPRMAPYIEKIKDSNYKTVLDIGTGSGAIHISLCHYLKDIQCTTVDISETAIEIAQKNAVNLEVKDRIKYVKSDVFENINETFDVIVSNPPYIRTEDLAGLQPEIFKFEPLAALDGKEDGLSSLKHIICSAHKFLKKYGTLILEIGHDQKAAVSRIIEKCGQYENIAFSKDYSRYDRVVQMSKK